MNVLHLATMITNADPTTPQQMRTLYSSWDDAPRRPLWYLVKLQRLQGRDFLCYVGDGGLLIRARTVACSGISDPMTPERQ